MCTSLTYKDTAGRTYFGRTLELTVDLPYQLAHFPAGFRISSVAKGDAPLDFTTEHAFVAIAMPDRVPGPQTPIGIADLKVLEGLNDKGLTFSLLSYPSAAGKQVSVAMTQAVLSASDLGSWVLGSFDSVAALKIALAAQPVALQPLAILGGVVSPFHYVAHDATGAALVIEFHHGEMTLHDNPVGVMTNGPTFDWHLTNLGNYTFLGNVDKSSATFGTYEAAQPDSGIATQGLPSSNTSVGRFVRAAYYARFTEKATTPDLAVLALSHIMNNFDRARGVTIDYPEGSGGHLEVKGLQEDAATPYATEFTSWTSLADLERGLFFVRDYAGLNYSRIDLGALSDATAPSVVSLRKLNGEAADASALLKA